MWTGDVQSGYPTQWALNPSAYQNLPNEQVDWATLAQQWIKMKETFPVDQVPPAPPPPSIKADIEAGEAPMDMSKDEVTPTPPTNNSQDGGNWGSWNNWGQWGWGWGAGGATGPVPPDKAAPYTFTPPTASHSFSTDTTTTTFDYNHGAPVSSDNFDQQGFWSGGPAPFVRNKQPQWREEYRESSNRKQSSLKVEEVEPDTTAIIDAAKRKQLPAWIREGLEKMEREKQKKIERERQLKEREEEMLRRKQEEEEALAAGIPVKSKFETDSEESEKEEEESPVKPRKSRFDNSTSSIVVPKPIVTKSYSPPPPVKRKSREQIMQEVMQQVRYVLTNILMTVTNEEMQKIAEDVLSDFRAKAPAAQLRNTPALTSLTGKLGLGIYDSDSEDSSSDSEDERLTKRENGVDSDDELRERISRKKQEFARIERDIEHMVEQQEERERERERERDLAEQDVTDEPPQVQGQVEPKLIQPGARLDVRSEDLRHVKELKSHEQNHTQFFTQEISYKVEKESSGDGTEDSDHKSFSKSDSSSSSSSSSGYKKSRKSSKKRKDKKSSKRKRKRSSSRGSERRKSHKKSSHRYEKEERRSRSRSRSRSRGYYDDHRHYRRHSSESSYKRHYHSYSHSPEHSRGKRSSHRSRD